VPWLFVIAVAAQAPLPDADAPTTRLDTRIRDLQQEAVRLAGAARTLLNELRALEVDRDLRRAEAQRAQAAFEDGQGALAAATSRLEELDRQRVEQLPGLKSQLVELYKRGRLGYATLLFAADDPRDFGRTSRVVAAMAHLGRQRIEQHRQLVEAVRRERTEIEVRTADLGRQQAEAARLRAAAERAVAAHAARIAAIDRRRDLAAQYAGELQVARQALLERLAAGGSATTAGLVPIVPFRGSLEWPVAGRLSGRFGESSNRLGGTAVRNGVEVAADEGRPVRAVHGGTVVHAGPFAGLGTLVIVDHGTDDYSLYGYLGTLAVAAGQAVDGGDPVGTVGPSPAGPPALYFELRIDGRSVDPVQWLEPR
jgi:septal ring factor EnvC (AmiA/AmiB activator)